MNKREIINKLIVDKDNATALIEKELVSFDSKVRLESLVDYLESMLERIKLKGNVWAI